MRGRLRSLSLSAVVAVALCGACASEEDPYETPPTLPDSMEPVGDGWTWGGEGEAPSFAAADTFCRRLTVASNPRLSAQVRGKQDGTTVSARVSDRDRRSYWSCMEGRGWKRASG